MRKHRFWFVLGCVWMLFGQSGVAGASLTSPDGWTHQFFALVCEHDPGSISLQQEQFPPPGCAPTALGSIQLQTAEGYLLDSCFTGSEGVCELSSPTMGSYIIEFVGGGIPTGFVARDNPNHFEPDQIINTGVVFVRASELIPQSDSADLEFHARDCPVDYAGEDFYNDCHDRLPEFQQVIVATGTSQRSIVTGDDGNSTFLGLPSGLWTFEPSLARDSAPSNVFCSDSAAPGVEIDRYQVVEHANRLLIEVTVRPRDSIVCDLYRIPVTGPKTETALITLHMKSCQKLESPGQIYADCFDGPGEDMFQMGNDQNYSIDGYTGPDGVITLELPPGRYWASGIYGHSIAATYTYCSLIDVPESGVESIPPLSAGEHWICDIYIKRESFR